MEFAVEIYNTCDRIYTGDSVRESNLKFFKQLSSILKIQFQIFQNHRYSQKRAFTYYLLKPLLHLRKGEI